MLKHALALAGALALLGCGQPQQELDDLITGVHYVGVAVPDVEAAATYYESAFDVERLGADEMDLAGLPAELTPDGVNELDSVLLRSANAQVRLMSFAGEDYTPSNADAVPVQGPGMMHVCFQAIQEATVYARAIAAGAEAIGAKDPVALTDRNPVKYGYVKDASGIVTEIEEVDTSKLDLPEPPKNSIRMRHIAFATPDLERMVSFYSAFFGGQEPRRIGSWFNLSGEQFDKVSGLPGSEIEMAWFQVRNLEIELATYHSHPTKLPDTVRPIDAPGYNMVVFEVTDLAAAKERLAAAGGTLLAGTTQLDGAEIAFGRDPDGNLLGLQALPEGSIYSAKNFADQGV